MAIAHTEVLMSPTPGSRALAPQPGDPDFKNPDTLDVEHIRIKYDVEKTAKESYIENLWQQFKDISTEELVRHTNREFPFYATRSKIADMLRNGG